MSKTKQKQKLSDRITSIFTIASLGALICYPSLAVEIGNRNQNLSLIEKNSSSKTLELQELSSLTKPTDIIKSQPFLLAQNGGAPQLVEFRSPHKTTSYPNATYYMTMKVPPNSSAVGQVSVQQQTNVDTINLNLNKTEAFVINENNKKVKVPVTVTSSKNSSNTIDVSFDSPIQGNNTVTIALKAKRNPSSDGVFQFTIKVFPHGINPVGFNLGVGRIHIYKSL